ncbi:hypothetical protein GOP47_0001193 [Adiantum capillus-veneris]|uniref:F-box domain-containing protein n=1 Tax=Adiantum capillus-veneris TaxID=13818 RepID=A0A9D4VFB7_ADICA|nr:hypothetical protein GOP47_0001193 [Adiantum capillus-veneris]
MVGEFNRRDNIMFSRNLSPLRISSAGKFNLFTPPSSPASYPSSPLLTPSSSAVDLASSPSCSSCPSTPFSCNISTPATFVTQLSFHEPLIPGLPDDLALECLLRVPYASQAVARAVCHRWKSFLCSDEYILARRNSGFAQPWLLVLAFHRVSGKIQWQAWDAAHRSWHIMAPMPCKERICPPGFGCVANLEEGALFVCGGMSSDMDCPMDAVLKYDLFRNQWTTMGSMSTPRSFFASGVIDGKIYAAGGNSTASHELSSAEVYDPVGDQWHPIASMGTNMARYDSAILSGKLYVTEGWSWPFLSSPRGQIYDPKADKWEDMTSGMREGWTGLSVVLNNHLYIISEHDSTKLKVFDKEGDIWKHVGGAPMPSHMALPFSVNTVGGKLVVVARSLHMAIGTITVSEEEGKPLSLVEWQPVPAPDAFSDFIPSHSVVLFV